VGWRGGEGSIDVSRGEGTIAITECSSTFTKSPAFEGFLREKGQGTVLSREQFAGAEKEGRHSLGRGGSVA